MLFRLFLFIFFVSSIFFVSGCFHNRQQDSVRNVNEQKQTVSNSNVNSNIDSTVTNVSTNAVNTSINVSSDDNSIDTSEPTPTPVPANLDDARGRDDQRIFDIKQLQEALQKYFSEKDVYPDTLAGLLPDYIADLPKNPEPGGQAYVYTPIGSLPAKFYDLSYALEVGTDEVTAGQHVATPKGIAQP